MNEKQRMLIISEYLATNVRVNDEMLAWMRSNHAGETGAVWIYKGARYVFWNHDIAAMAQEHGENEKRHLVVMEHLVDKHNHSKLLPLWRISGFVLGLLPALVGYRAFCITIEAVETFVESHYQEQINYLMQANSQPDLLRILQRCCDEEVEHQQDAAVKKGLSNVNWFSQFWCRLVGNGSDIAVRLAKAI